MDGIEGRKQLHPRFWTRQKSLPSTAMRKTPNWGKRKIQVKRGKRACQVRLSGKHPIGEKEKYKLKEAKELAKYGYEENTQLGKKKNTMEDVLTGLSIHCRGWKSVYCCPKRHAFVGCVPVNLNDTLIQNKRWATGLLEIFASKYCPLTYGRMWMLKGVSSYLFGVIQVVWKLLGISKVGFEVTSKVFDSQAAKRYEAEIFEFGVSSALFIPFSIIGLINLLALMGGIAGVMREGYSAIVSMFV
ncbi:cellulose synthase-like protein E1 [Cryptomeria japonica]|uniref:cellulose synthase-like protein E1 n=1 Tax=Cryptomeria japonica TaxID=3369 RepID=UPI0027D9D49F|nr:cellulose synthase-like protein E1 [Cryptomeria japonica]